MTNETANPLRQMAAAENPKTNDPKVNLQFFADSSSDADDDDDDDENLNANDKKINKYLKFNISPVCTPNVFHPPEHTTDAKKAPAVTTLHQTAP